MEPTLLAPDVRVGDRLPTLEVDVTPRTVVMGASASRDWQPQHHDYRHCVDVANLPDIFLNTPNQAGFIERYVTDWGGPHARLGRMQFRMKKTVVPGDTLRFDAEVAAVMPDDQGTSWVDLEVDLTVGGQTVTRCTVRVALPADADDNPWRKRGDRWTPLGADPADPRD